jgi:hypothetical protein
MDNTNIKHDPGWIVTDMLATEEPSLATPVPGVGVATEPDPELVARRVPGETEEGVATVPLVTTVVAGLATRSAPQAPVRLLIAAMLTRAAGVEPQFADWVIQMMLLSRSKTAITQC